MTLVVQLPRFIQPVAKKAILAQVYVRAPGCKHPSCQCLCTEMTGDLALGYSCCLIAGVGFGINYLPVKGIDTGDGIFFSAVMSVGILAVGVVTRNLTQSLNRINTAINPTSPTPYEPYTPLTTCRLGHRDGA